MIIGARYKNLLFEVDEIRDENRLFELHNGNFREVDPKNHPASKDIQRVMSNRLSNLDVNTHRLENEVERDVQDRLKDFGYL